MLMDIYVQIVPGTRQTPEGINEPTLMVHNASSVGIPSDKLAANGRVIKIRIDVPEALWAIPTYDADVITPEEAIAQLHDWQKELKAT